MKKLLGILLGATLALGLFAAPVSADTRCGGRYGVQLYADTFYHGSSVVLCAPAGTQKLASSNLGNITGGWNDRVSSYQVFNAGTKTTRFYPDINYAGSKYITTVGNDNVPDLTVFWVSRDWPDGFNDEMSSLRNLP